MIINPKDYVDYIVAHKKPSQRTIFDYNDTLTKIGIGAFETENVEEEVYKVLLDGLMSNTYGYVHILRFLSICSSWYKTLTGKHLKKELLYNTLYNEIKQRQGTRQPYSDDDILMLFAAANAFGDGGSLLRLIYLVYYSGLRVSAPQGLRWLDLKPVQGHEELMTYRVTSKGTTYNAFIPTRLYKHMKSTVIGQFSNESLIVDYRKDAKTPFNVYYNTKLMEALQKKYLNDDYIQLRKDHSLFHSLRKTFSQKLANAGLTSDSIQLLMAHAPPNISYRKYIMPDRKNQPESLVDRMAQDYLKCRDLMDCKLHVGLTFNPPIEVLA